MIYRAVRWAYGLAEVVWMEHLPAAATPVACERRHPRLPGGGLRVPCQGDAPGVMPTNGGNGYDVSVVGEGSGPDAKAARPAESPRWTAGRGPGVGPVPGVGVVGHSRELLRGALVYAARGVPVFPCEAGGKRPLTADGFLEATTDEARIREWWAKMAERERGDPHGRALGPARA